ncbi:PAK3 kinase, partial [Rhodinocichla rosea]|nr:PAK3 kinase [Rhodinocichla rosea]
FQCQGLKGSFCCFCLSRGFGAVYKALDTSSGQQVAIKIMSLEEGMSEELAANEILAKRGNRSPNIVTYL